MKSLSNNKEAVAKLQRMDKTMILDQFTSHAAAGNLDPRAHTRGSRTRGRGFFNMRWSFATASETCNIFYIVQNF